LCAGGRAGHGANVVQLAAVRAQRLATQQAARKAARRHWGWLEWSALALVMVLGLAAGKFGWRAGSPTGLASRRRRLPKWPAATACWWRRAGWPSR
jgi:hypothetical protein